ncbi:hypothetical protein BG006_008817 [Podila minutissima]|uniref:FAD-binding domain-containing protein n=1 Tax=Podila minutissima TaxID=64525 RepID=A0A9P5STS2_9FUNG|nr:hypothetical protein BG006_008817 [Podila minutissima]
MSNSDSSINSSSGSSVIDASTPVQKIPVLIVGAGPVGLFEAVLLTRMGIHVRVIEREPEIAPMSRALGTHVRSLEILSLVEEGFIDKFLAQGRPLVDAHMFYGSRPMCAMPVTSINTSKFEWPLFMEQERLAKILEKDLAEMGVYVEYGWELTDTEAVESTGGTEESYAKTVIRRTIAPEGQEHELKVVRSEYLIAADGGRSTVRHKINVQFPGRTLPFRTIMFDGAIETDMEKHEISAVVGVNRKTVVFFHMHDNIYRIVLEHGQFAPNDDLDQVNRDLTVEDFERNVRACLHPGTEFKVLSKLWLICFRVNERRAENYVHKGRIFLVGDAAHVHSPAGGQGMNTGLQDAYNLAWKLGLVMNKLAPATLLQSYHEERQPMADRAIALSSALMARARDGGLINHYMKRVFMILSPLLAKIGIAVFPPAANMLEIRYPANDINLPHKTQKQPNNVAHQVGARAPDGPLLCLLPASKDPSPVDKNKATSVEKNCVFVHDVIVGVGRFHILVLVSNSLVDPASLQERQEALAKSIKDNLSQWRTRWHFITVQGDKPDNQLFKLHVVATGTLSDSHRNGLLAQCAQGDGRLFWDCSEEVHTAFGVPAKAKGRSSMSEGAIVVVRPDSHIGFRVQGLDKSAWRDVTEYFETILA